MSQSMLSQLSEQAKYLVDQSMAHMDQLYDKDAGMLRDVEESQRHNTRGSGHYAVGLLLRNEPGDLERACILIGKVLDMQFDDPDEIYHGTFRAAPEAALPWKGTLPWKELGAGIGYTADEKVLSPVWKTYDPNWREFIACTFAVILEQFEELLPAELVGRMDASMEKAIVGSIERRLSGAIPMNSNIELMHIFVTHYFGHRLRNKNWLVHASQEAIAFHSAFMEYGSLAEFNTTTYYGVDITVLGLWRKYAKSDEMKRIGSELEKGLWESIALFYNPYLQNLSGPFARAYEMEMLGHSSMGVFLYLVLGKGYEYLAAINCESEHDPIIALVGVNVPEYVKPLLETFQENRLAVAKFRELCERDLPEEQGHICTAKAWIEKDLMLGAMSGSKNTNGQMHPATIHWCTQNGQKYYLRLLKRDSGGHWNTHSRGITFEANVRENELDVQVSLQTQQATDIYFEISGGPLDVNDVTAEKWSLPGLSLQVDSNAQAPVIQQVGSMIEVVYAHQPDRSDSQMSFKLSVVGR
ncbi:hypothetical protein [Paenibacillus sinopodophylli]|uniref:hypothetical protein n=1 Tax=Paenibacillus sinopodophylli TaxID=1837342 RepID=UPI00110C98C9|nr:hypothetical protein [Paenibacillus sinopodophylli]